MTTKDKILMVSLKLFLTQGYESTTLSMIADEVQIKKPSIYYYFKSKKDLLFNSINLILDRLEEQINHSFTNTPNTKDKMEAFFECLLNFNSNLSTILDYDFKTPVNLILFFQISANSFPELSDRIDGYYTRVCNVLGDVIKEGQEKALIKTTTNDEMMIIDIIARIEGFITLSFIYKSVDIKNNKKQFFDNLWTSLTTIHSNSSARRKLIDYSRIDLGRKW